MPAHPQTAALPPDPVPTELGLRLGEDASGTVAEVDDAPKKDERGLAREAWTKKAAETAAKQRLGRLSELEDSRLRIIAARDSLGILLEADPLSPVRIRSALFADGTTRALEEETGGPDDDDEYDDAERFLPLRAPDPALSPQRAAENPGALREKIRADLARRPPWAQLGNRPSRAGALWLTAVAVAHGTRQPGRRVGNERHNGRDGGRGWAFLLAAPGQADDPRRTVVRCVKRLAEYELAGPRVTTPAPRWHGWRLYNEHGTAAIYTVPDPDDRNEDWCIEIPREFFRQGWHLVLTHAEMHVLFMIMDLAKTFPGRHSDDGVFAVPRVRRGEYGMTDEVYLAHRTLAEFGLIKRIDGVHGRRAGKVRLEPDHDPNDPMPIEPYRFKVRKAAMSKDPLKVVTRCLDMEPVPPRFDEFAAPDPLSLLPH